MQECSQGYFTNMNVVTDKATDPLEVPVVTNDSWTSSTISP